MLGEQGEVTEAVEVMRKALLLEPANADLVAQEKELRVIELERAAEMAFNASRTVPTTTAAATSAAAAVGGDTTMKMKTSLPSGVGLIDFFKQHLSDTVNLAAAATLASEVATAVASDPALCIYARTSGVVELLTEVVKSLAAEHSNATDSVHLQAFLVLLAKLIDGQRASKLLLVEGKVLISVKALLADTLLSDLSLSEAALQLIFCACKDDISIKARASMLADKPLYSSLGALLGNISFEASSNNRVLSEKERSVLRMCAEIVKLSAFVEQGQATFASLDAVAGASLVGGVASALYTVNTSGFAGATSTMQEQKLALLDLLVEASLGMSQTEALRAHFALQVPMAENKLNKSKYSSSLCGSLLATMKSHDHLSTNGMAALMNACLEASLSVRKAVLEGGGLAIAMADLSLSDAQRSQKEGVSLLRRAGLLARLTGDETAITVLSKPETYRLLCRRIVVPAVRPTDAATEKCQAEERAHFVRVLANLTKPSAACMAVGMQEGILPALLAVLPTPRLDCGEVTALSVTLVPYDLAPALHLGNAARCIMPYADEIAYATELYTNKAWQGVEKLICAMASCPDMRVRKNIAILLAKGCRVPGVREKMTALRGMQMMIELQDKL